MLADSISDSACFGAFGKDVQKPNTYLLQLLDFIKGQLPIWRDRLDRKHETSETHLTSQLCAHLNSASRHAPGWDSVQFRTEEPDEQKKGRKIDLIPAPSGESFLIQGRRYSDFDTLLPIECKRLPTPAGVDRDAREYLISQFSTTGGVHRFKEGLHGADHTQGAMIAYVQNKTSKHWLEQISLWIDNLIASGQNGWSAKDHLKINSQTNGVMELNSKHTRSNGRKPIDLRHFWIKM